MATVSPSPMGPAHSSAKVSAMFMIALRVVFVLALIAVGWSLASDKRLVSGALAGQGDLIVIGFAGAALVVIAFDIFVPRKSLTAISGLFFGLIVGMVVAYGLSLIIDLLVAANVPGELTEFWQSFISAVKLALGVICCYLAVSFILQTKDDVRFVIPYLGDADPGIDGDRSAFRAPRAANDRGQLGQTEANERQARTGYAQQASGQRQR